MKKNKVLFLSQKLLEILKNKNYSKKYYVLEDGSMVRGSSFSLYDTYTASAIMLGSFIAEVIYTEEAISNDQRLYLMELGFLISLLEEKYTGIDCEYRVDSDGITTRFCYLNDSMDFNKGTFLVLIKHLSRLNFSQEIKHTNYDLDSMLREYGFNSVNPVLTSAFSAKN